MYVDKIVRCKNLNNYYVSDKMTRIGAIILLIVVELFYAFSWLHGALDVASKAMGYSHIMRFGLTILIFVSRDSQTMERHKKMAIALINVILHTCCTFILSVSLYDVRSISYYSFMIYPLLDYEMQICEAEEVPSPPADDIFTMFEDIHFSRHSAPPAYDTLNFAA